MLPFETPPSGGPNLVGFERLHCPTLLPNQHATAAHSTTCAASFPRASVCFASLFNPPLPLSSRIAHRGTEHSRKQQKRQDASDAGRCRGMCGTRIVREVRSRLRFLCGSEDHWEQRARRTARASPERCFCCLPRVRSCAQLHHAPPFASSAAGRGRDAGSTHVRHDGGGSGLSVRASVSLSPLLVSARSLSLQR
jgi:hypothetical protein